MNKGVKGTSKPVGLGTPMTGSSTMGGGNIGATGTVNVRGHGRPGNGGSFSSGTPGPAAARPSGFHVGGKGS